MSANQKHTTSSVSLRRMFDKLVRLALRLDTRRQRRWRLMRENSQFR